MADITAQNFLVYQDGSCLKTILLACKNATAGDTVDVGAFMRVIKRAGMISASGTHVASLTNTGTVITIPAGPAQDGVWLLVVGVPV
jgi:hypothetical protein